MDMSAETIKHRSDLEMQLYPLLTAYAKANGLADGPDEVAAEIETVIGDLIGDLLHVAAYAKLDGDGRARAARVAAKGTGHFLAERAAVEAGDNPRNGSEHDTITYEQFQQFAGLVRERINPALR